MPQQYLLSVSHPSIYSSIPSSSNKSIFILHTYNIRCRSIQRDTPPNIYCQKDFRAKEPSCSPSSKPELALGLHIHTFRGLLTILMQNEHSGLQIEHEINLAILWIVQPIKVFLCRLHNRSKASLWWMFSLNLSFTGVYQTDYVNMMGNEFLSIHYPTHILTRLGIFLR